MDFLPRLAADFKEVEPRDSVEAAPYFQEMMFHPWSSFAIMPIFALATSSGNGDFEPMAEINVTPMVDVMLVLLIIFRSRLRS